MIKNKFHIIILIFLAFLSTLFLCMKMIFMTGERALFDSIGRDTKFFISLWIEKIETSVYTYNYKKLSNILKTISQEKSVYFVKVDLINGQSFSYGKPIPRAILSSSYLKQGKSFCKKVEEGIISVAVHEIGKEGEGFLWGRIVFGRLYNDVIGKKMIYFFLLSLFFSSMIVIFIVSKIKLVRRDFYLLSEEIERINDGEKRKIDGEFFFLETYNLAEELNSFIESIESEKVEYINSISELEKAITKGKRMIKSLTRKIDNRKKELQRLKQEIVEAEQYSSFITFISGLAHELNNPLTTVYGYLEIISNSKKANPALREWAENTIEEISKIQLKINEYTDIISQTGLLTQEFVDLKRIIETICKEKGFKFVDHVGSRLFVPGNPFILEQSFKALFNFIGEKGDRVTVARLKEKKGNLITIEFSLKSKFDYSFLKDRLKRLIYPFSFKTDVSDKKIIIQIRTD